MGGFYGQAGVPNFSGYVWLALGTWGGGGVVPVVAPVGLVFGQNPSYYLDNFLAMYPKFFGPPTLIANAGTTISSNVVTVQSTIGLAAGQFVVIPNVPQGTVITAVGNGQITISNQATVTQSSVGFTAYEAPPIPLAIIQTYINLANASLVFNRWQEQWTIGMSLFVAHYCTLYAKSDAAEITSVLQSYIHSETPQGAIPGTIYTLSAAPPSGTLQGFFVNGSFMTPGVNADYTLSGQTITTNVATPGGAKLLATWPLQMAVQTQGVPSTAQLAAQGLMTGVESSKSVGDVSASYTVLQEQLSWGQFSLTLYGSQLIDMAKVIGTGPMLFV